MELRVSHVFDAEDPKRAAAEYVQEYTGELVNLIVSLHNDQLKLVLQTLLDALEHYHLHLTEALKGKGVFLPDSLYGELQHCLVDEVVGRVKAYSISAELLPLEEV